ncbi:hypothetical protein JTE90_026326 [Oedothorax gibbosus]|uniref:Uncharacterized protein n=1 Tax=Oedothorax gibbosus TaxID=931172 RepID=A0AAV6U6E4_9ARAC|nr:hypothetical protein JTE90_026326 [Oedothorax gibbosus]
MSDNVIRRNNGSAPTCPEILSNASHSTLSPSHSTTAWLVGVFTHKSEAARNWNMPLTSLPLRASPTFRSRRRKK